MNISSRVRQEQLSKRILTIVSVFGWLLISYSIFQFKPITGDLWTPVVLILFLFVTELYPIPVWRGMTSLSFPLVYTLVVMYGVWTGILIYAMVSFIINLIANRPKRVVWFNPAQLSISLCFAHFTTLWLLERLAGTMSGDLIYNILHALFFTLFFYFINNLLIDLILWLRPHPYQLKDWKQKILQESIIAFVSSIYITSMFLLGSQNRGVVDVFSYLFFFAPLVAVSIISAIISRLQIEKNRLNALFSITKELNRKLPSSNWAEMLEQRFQEYIPTDAFLLMTKEEKGWTVSIRVGGINPNPEQLFEREWFENIAETSRYRHREQIPDEVERLFHESIRSVVVTPLRIEEEMLGIILVGKTNNQGYQISDLQFVSTLANQIAVILKTRLLFSERERRILLEERNRIAREIHDGIAQSLAGAVMKLETSKRILEKDAGHSEQLVEESIQKLRGSLGEVRESIYALRPYPTDKVGIKNAIQSRMKEFTNDYHIPATLQVRGSTRTLPSHIEKILYEILSEGLQNAGKHSEATKMSIVLKYGKKAVILRIKDNGQGFKLYHALMKAKKDAHYGILNMNELAEQVEASLKINSLPQRGTEILLIVPTADEYKGEK
ncbi:histidine kinase [Alkalihalobacillus sp. AL-G]|uniref:GAF domain-containing sensor histidine kinase n=1 Tax=Alkalihalobacillus sp. AL-G TaxID=2926399 RepID=UPI00272C27AB|nr:histidine kinase [Alkalihalobacillus sp. AL-G]WLD94816.1 histidine kinase [Alkalihalobacillus sp. AL-G]